MKQTILLSSFLFATVVYAANYPVVDTGQKNYYSNKGYIAKPDHDDSYFGQDSNYLGYQPNYTDNHNGTISDNITNLMWQKAVLKKMTYRESVEYAKSSTLGGFNDWRIPTIKELYSLMNFNGQTGKGNPSSSTVPQDAKPYINTDYFDFEYPNERRYIDAQYWSSTDYESTTMRGAKTFFGVNFADGRIKGYPKYNAKNGQASYYLRLVRGNPQYGKNNFIDNNDGTIFDKATNLLWMKDDSKKGMGWDDALRYCERLSYSGKTNWRLPNAKELHSLIDYSRTPDTTSSASISTLFQSSIITNEGNKKDFPFYWSSTTHLDGREVGSFAVYFAFGRALGYMKDPRTGTRSLLDVHGSGAQRSDPKSGGTYQYSQGHGPQGDVVRIKNYARCVSDDFTTLNGSGDYEIKSSHNLDRLLGQKGFKKDGYSNSSIQEDFSSSSSRGIQQRVGGEHPLLGRFDRNNDGKIAYSEAPSRMKKNFNRHDINKDGFLDSYELKTLPKPPR